MPTSLIRAGLSQSKKFHDAGAFCLSAPNNLAPFEDQTPSAVRAMYIGFIWIPVACQSTAAVLLRFYRLKKSDLEGRSGVMPSDGG